MAGLALGVDGGASKTVAVVVDRRGRVLGAGRAGNADIYQTPHAVEAVAAAAAAALRAAGAAARDLDAAALSLVGADWPEDFAHWRAAMGRLGLGHLAPDRARVVNDAIGALAAGAPEGAPAVAVVCGTGCAVGARGPQGDLWHTSFWQRTQGGVEIARRALDAVYLAELGIGPATALGAAALRHFRARDVEDLLHAFTGRERARPATVAGLAPLVLDAARAGDAVARRIARDHADALALHGLAAARRVGIGATDGSPAEDAGAAAPARLVLAGGVFRHPSRLMADRVAATMRRAMPTLAVVEGAPEPVAGAALLALEAVGVRPGGPERERLRATLPSEGFFRTAPHDEAPAPARTG